MFELATITIPAELSILALGYPVGAVTLVVIISESLTAMLKFSDINSISPSTKLGFIPN